MAKIIGLKMDVVLASYADDGTSEHLEAHADELDDGTFEFVVHIREYKPDPENELNLILTLEEKETTIFDSVEDLTKFMRSYGVL